MDIEVMLESPYVTFMAIRPLVFGDKTYEPGKKIPQRLLIPMRDPEVLIRTGHMAAVAKDMNKVPVWIRPSVEDEAVMRARVTQSTSPIGEIIPGLLLEIEEVLDQHEEDTEVEEESSGDESETIDQSADGAEEEQEQGDE